LKTKVTIYTINDLIEMLGVSRTTIIKYIKQKKIRAFKVGNTWRITEQAFLEYIKESESEQ
jgi:excisionase family DNA binding protein